MTAKGQTRNSRFVLWGSILLLAVSIFYFVLNNEGIRNELIEILLPLLERLLHQFEREIVGIIPFFYS